MTSVFKSRKLFSNESSLEFLPSTAAEKDSTPIMWERKMFNKLRPYRCCFRIPQEERVRGFYSTLVTSFTEGWMLGSVVGGAAVGVRPGKQVSPLCHGRAQCLQY